MINVQIEDHETLEMALDAMVEAVTRNTTDTEIHEAAGRIWEHDGDEDEAIDQMMARRGRLLTEWDGHCEDVNNDMRRDQQRGL